MGSLLGEEGADNSSSTSLALADTDVWLNSNLAASLFPEKGKTSNQGSRSVCAQMKE
jgi:hypothetical protein